MHDIFKKHILRSEKYLLPTLNGAKKIRINEKDYDNFKEVIKDFDKSLFQLPRDITCFESNRYILLLIDQFKNQKGYGKNRKIIVFIKVKNNKEVENYFNYLNIEGELRDDKKLSGVALFSTLLGLRYSEESSNYPDEERVNSLSETQKKAMSFCFDNNDVYLKFSLDVIGLNIKVDKTFYIITKKTSMKVDISEYSNEYIEKKLYSRMSKLVNRIYDSIIYHNIILAERKKE